MLYILAGNAAQAATYCREHNISLPEARYVSQSYHLAGVKEPEYVVVGTFWDSPRSIDTWKTLLASYAGSKKPVPRAPPHIQPFLNPVLPNAPVSNVVSIPNPNPGVAILDPLDEPTPKRKKSFKKIRP